MEEKSRPMWEQFLNMCLSVNSFAELDELMGFCLTIEEREDISSRVALVQALLRGKQSQRDIAKSLGISIAKITRGSNALKIIKPTTRAFLQRMLVDTDT